MSSELAPFFPSSNHPALSVAHTVLSTLRNLTGPGKGNDLKAEERAALAGVSALIACEKVHSKDLVEKTAQKASSVSPAHFRSALRLARTLLNSQTADDLAPSPTRRTSTRASNAAASSSTSAGTGVIPNLPSPFSTPKKKYKYTSGVDISSLRKHTPTKGSPLKQSVTPRRRAEAAPGTLGREAADAEEVEEEEEREEVEDVDMETPTKARNAQPLAGEGSKRKRRDKEEDMEAFFALRPGSGVAGTGGTAGPSRFQGFAHDPTAGLNRQRRTEAERKARRVRRKRDWTFAEEVWGGEAVVRRNEKVLERLKEDWARREDGEGV